VPTSHVAASGFSKDSAALSLTTISMMFSHLEDCPHARAHEKENMIAWCSILRASFWCFCIYFV
jgi:hypothetical protein